MSLLDLLDRPIAFHRIFVKLTGSVTAALMLSQAFYWSKRTSNPDGWFYKTQAEWEDETGMGRYEQEGARKVLRDLPFWEEKRAGVPAKLYFRINLSSLGDLLTDLVAEKPQTSMGKDPNPECGKTTNKSAENQQAIYIQRIHTEITPKITSEREEGEAPRSPLPHQRFVEAQFVRESEPWMNSSDSNSIDPGFVKYVQDWLKGRGAYEKKDPTVGDTKTYIRKYRLEPRGSERRQAMLEAIANKWESYLEHGNRLNETELDYELLREKARLDWTDELPMQWSERFGKGIYYAAQLTAKQKLEYLNWLRTQETDPAPEVTHYAA